MLFGGVSAKEKLFFAEHFFLMLKSATPLAEALDILQKEARSRAFKKILKDVLARVKEGESLGKSLGRYRKTFGDLFIRVIRVGEESGSLEENLHQLSIAIKSEYSLKKRLAGALIYPVLILTIAVVVISGIMIFVLPRLMGFFKAFNLQLPLATKVLLAVSSFLTQNWPMVLVGLIILVLSLKLLLRISIIKLYIHKNILSAPVLGQVEKNKNLARFARDFYTLYKSGVPLMEVLAMCQKTVSNEAFKRHIDYVIEGVGRGEKISDGLKKAPKLFPPVFSQMVLIGEKTGSLEESMLYLAEFYESEVDSTVKDLSSLLEPVLLIFVAGFILFIALAIILPIYKVTSSIEIYGF